MFPWNRKWTALLPRWCMLQITLVGMCLNWGLWVVFCLCVCVTFAKKKWNAYALIMTFFILTTPCWRDIPPSYSMNQLVMEQNKKGKKIIWQDICIMLLLMIQMIPWGEHLVTSCTCFNRNAHCDCSQVLKDMMTAIDADSSGTVSLQEWVEGGMNNVPLLVLLGLKVGKHKYRFSHSFRCKVIELRCYFWSVQDYSSYYTAQKEWQKGTEKTM